MKSNNRHSVDNHKDADEGKSSQCNFAGDNVLCAKPSTEDVRVAFWVSVHNADHKDGGQTVRAPALVTIESTGNPALLPLICDRYDDVKCSDIFPNKNGFALKTLYVG